MLATGAVLLVVIAESYLQHFDSYPIAGPILLGAAVCLAYSRRHLVEWQERHGVRVCTRAGVRRFAWTRAQARSRMVTIPLTAD